MVKTSLKSVFNKNKISKSLVQQIIHATKYCYAPYSHIKVGAGVYCDSGTIYTGVNIENSSYGLSMCAERVAMYKAIAAGERKFHLMVVYSPQIDFISPCGACLQVINEFAPQIMIVTMNKKRQFRFLPIQYLLKQPFTHPHKPRVER